MAVEGHSLTLPPYLGWYGALRRPRRVQRRKGVPGEHWPNPSARWTRAGTSQRDVPTTGGSVNMRRSEARGFGMIGL